MLRENLSGGGAEPELLVLILRVGEDSEVSTTPEDTVPLPGHPQLAQV